MLEFLSDNEQLGRGIQTSMWLRMWRCDIQREGILVAPMVVDMGGSTRSNQKLDENSSYDLTFWAAGLQFGVHIVCHHILLEKWDSGVRETQQKFCWFYVRVRNSWFRITIERIILVRCWFYVQVTLVVKKWYLWVKFTPHIPGLVIYTPRARPPSLA